MDEVIGIITEERNKHKETLSALAGMWNQYCSNESGHEFMSAGERASEVLERYGLLTPKEGKEINAMCGNAEVDYPLTPTEHEEFFEKALKEQREEIMRKIEEMIKENTRGNPFPTIEEEVARDIIKLIQGI